MKQLHRSVLYASLTFILCSCASDGDYRSSMSINGMTMPGMDLNNPRFYMDADKEIAPVLSDPKFYDKSPGVYCDRICGF